MCFEAWLCLQLDQQQRVSWRQRGVAPANHCVSPRDEQTSAPNLLSNPASDESLLLLTAQLESLEVGGGETITLKRKQGPPAAAPRHPLPGFLLGVKVCL